MPSDQVLAKVRELAQVMASKSPTIMRANNNEHHRTIEYVVDTMCHIIDTEDAQEGLNAFVENRQPEWS